MKFMIINRPTGFNAKSVESQPKHLRAYADQIRGWIRNKDIECCYHMVGGGHVYVVNADTIDQLTLMVRRNPLFEESNTEVIPITDAHDFLEHYSSFLESTQRAS
jgi:hypothetical protein